MRFCRPSPLTPSSHHQHRHHNRPASLLLLLLALCGSVVIHTTVWRTSRETESAVNCHPTATIASPSSSSFAKSGNKTNDTGRQGVITIPGIPAAETDQQHRVLIVTLSTGDGADAYTAALENHAAYARCHKGYDFLNYNVTTTTAGNNNNNKVHPFMQKAFALRSILSNTDNAGYHHVLWIDRDAIFMNHGISIAKRLQEMMNEDTTNDGFDEDDNINNNNDLSSTRKSYDLFVAVESWAWLNSGVLLFRNTPFSRQLVDDWIRIYQSRAKNYHDRISKIHIGGQSKTFADLFPLKWHCEDQGALIALLAGYDESKKWNTDRFDGLGVPICCTRVMMNGPKSRHLYSLIQNTERRSRLWPNNGSIPIHGIKKSTRRTEKRKSMDNDTKPFNLLFTISMGRITSPH
jgi:hypothetical protein